MAKFKILPVHDFNLDDPRLQKDNVIPIPEIFVPGFRSTHPYNIWYGSRYSAKSWTKAKQYLVKATDPGHFRAVFARMSQKSARKSQFQLFKDTLKRYPLLRAQFHVKETEMQIIHRTTGNYLQGGSFEQSDDLMSVPELTHAWIEEPITRKSVLSKTAFEDIAGTLRSDTGVQPQLDMTFNPIHKSNFIYREFFENKIYDAHIIKANYYDNPFCPIDRMVHLNEMSRTNPTRHNIDGKGNWGVVATGFEYYGGFDRGRHEQREEVKPLPIHITFDFNVLPYMTAVVNQVYQLPDGRVCFHAIKEYTLPPPHSTIKATCKAVLKEWEPHIKKYGCFIYGDATGNNRIPSDQVRTLFKDVRRHMRGYVGHSNLRISKRNRRHLTVGSKLGRYELMLQLMSDYEQYIYRVDPACVKTIEDYESVQIGPNGGKAKTRTKEGGVSFEKYGHTSDAQDYFLCWQLQYQFRL